MRLLLASDGMEPPELDLQRAWPVFKYFATLVADSEEDVIGFQARWVGETAEDPIMVCTWVRQLTDEAPGFRLTRAIELDYTLDTPFNPRIEDVELWSDDYGSVAEFFGEVEQLPHFLLAAQSTVAMCDIYAEDEEAQ